MPRKEDRHSGCCYREFCTKVDKWCPYLSNGRHTCNEYEDNYLFKRRKKR